MKTIFFLVLFSSFIAKAADLTSCAPKPGTDLEIQWNVPNVIVSPKVPNAAKQTEWGTEIATFLSGPCKDLKLYTYSIYPQRGEMSCEPDFYALIDGSSEMGNECDTPNDRNIPSRIHYALDLKGKRVIVLKKFFTRSTDIRETSDQEIHNFENLIKLTMQAVKTGHPEITKHSIDQKTEKMTTLFPPDQIEIKGVTFKEKYDDKPIFESFHNGQKPFYESKSIKAFFWPTIPTLVMIVFDTMPYEYVSNDLKKHIEGYSFVERVQMNDNELKKTDQFFEIKNTEDKKFKALYDSYVRAIDEFNKAFEYDKRACQGNSACLEKLPKTLTAVSQKDFPSLKPVLFWKDPLGQWQKFAKRLSNIPLPR